MYKSTYKQQVAIVYETVAPSVGFQQTLLEEIQK